MGSFRREGVPIAAACALSWAKSSLSPAKTVWSGCLCGVPCIPVPLEVMRSQTHGESRCEGPRAVFDVTSMHAIARTRTCLRKCACAHARAHELEGLDGPRRAHTTTVETPGCICAGAGISLMRKWRGFVCARARARACNTVCVCVCVCARARACGRAVVRACMRACRQQFFCLCGSVPVPVSVSVPVPVLVPVCVHVCARACVQRTSPCMLASDNPRPPPKRQVGRECAGDGASAHVRSRGSDADAGAPRRGESGTRAQGNAGGAAVPRRRGQGAQHARGDRRPQRP